MENFDNVEFKRCAFLKVMPKRQEIEILRILSAFAIVWFHSGALGGELFYGGLVAFLVLSFCMAGYSKSRHSDYVSRYAKRLLIPWFAWFLIYGGINILIGKAFIPLGNGIFAGIFAGPSIHLWYLPFVFTCLVLFHILRRYISPSVMASVSAICGIVILVTVPVWRTDSVIMGYPFAQYAHALAAVFLGIFFACLRVTSGSLLLLLLIFAASVSAVSWPGIGIPYLVGIVAGCIFIFPCGGRLSVFNVEVVSQHMFGVYLIHPIFLRILKKINFNYWMFVPIVSFVLSIVAVYIIKKFLPRIARFCF